MYLSRLKLDPSRRKTRELMISPYQLHQSIYRAFPDKSEGGPGRILYRVDRDRRTGSLSLLVQSEKEPEWGRSDYLWECLAREHETKPFEPYLFRGQVLHFRLKANPSVKKQQEGKKNGFRTGLLREEDQLDWLKRKAERSGFKVGRCRTVPEGMIDSRKQRSEKNMRHFGVLFEGTLQVTEPGKFQETLRDGIGSAKGFGFGLLSIAPAGG